jgi:hypothetical protein
MLGSTGARALGRPGIGAQAAVASVRPEGDYSVRCLDDQRDDQYCPSWAYRNLFLIVSARGEDQKTASLPEKSVIYNAGVSRFARRKPKFG